MPFCAAALLPLSSLSSTVGPHVTAFRCIDAEVRMSKPAAHVRPADVALPRPASGHENLSSECHQQAELKPVIKGGKKKRKLGLARGASADMPKTRTAWCRNVCNSRPNVQHPQKAFALGAFRIHTASKARSARNLKVAAKPVSREAADGLSDTLNSLDVFLGAVTEPVAAQDLLGGESGGVEALQPQEPAAAATGASAAEDKLKTNSKDQVALKTPAAYLSAAWQLGAGWFRDYIKPTAIVDADDPDIPRARSRFSYLMLALNIMVYAVGLSFRFSEGQDGPTDFFLSLANVNDGVETGEYYRLITANFLHDSFVHLGLSCYALVTFAPEAEAVLGGFTFLSAYLLSGVAGSALCFLLTDTLTVGASSGIFGLIGALGAFLYKNHKVPHSSEQVLMTAGLVLFNLVLGGKQESAIDNLGHLGGLLCGVYLGYLLTPTIQKIPLDSSTESTEKQSDASARLDMADSRDQDIDVHQAEGKTRVLRPNSLQSGVVLLCVSLTLSSGVAATVLHRTGELPFLKLPSWLA